MVNYFTPSSLPAAGEKERLSNLRSFSSAHSLTSVHGSFQLLECSTLLWLVRSEKSGAAAFFIIFFLYLNPFSRSCNAWTEEKRKRPQRDAQFEVHSVFFFLPPRSTFFWTQKEWLDRRVLSSKRVRIKCLPH